MTKIAQVDEYVYLDRMFIKYEQGQNLRHGNVAVIFPEKNAYSSLFIWK